MPDYSASETRGRIVSFDQEPLILVDKDNSITGYLDKVTCHQGQGKLHRAFSVFLFNQAGELLLQQRSALKPLWPMYWANSCCSHPRKGETVLEAAHRRTLEELGIKTNLTLLYHFIYQSTYLDIGSEHELCSVLIGRCDTPPVLNINEVNAFKFITPAALTTALKNQPERYSPWLHLEWPRLMTEHKAQITQLTS